MSFEGVSGMDEEDRGGPGGPLWFLSGVVKLSRCSQAQTLTQTERERERESKKEREREREGLVDGEKEGDGTASEIGVARY